MSITYFIDSENMGDSWISLLNKITLDDSIIVFYTSKSPNISYKNVILIKQSSMNIEFIECYEGNNALDFQLCTELGYRINNISDNQFIIVSNDKGFDAVIKYWVRQNKSVKRITGKECSDTNIKEKIDDDSLKTTIKQLPQIYTSNDNMFKGVDDNAKEILYIIGKNNLQELHEALKHLYGNKNGKTIYNDFKKETSYNNFLSKHKKMSIDEKYYKYCSIVFSIMLPSENMPEDFPKYIIESWNKKKNLNSLKALLQQKYGKELGEKYYSTFKIHIKLLYKIK